MFRFFLKKSFYDGWDSMLILAAFNAGLLAIAAIGILIPARFDAPVMKILGLIFLCLAFGVWSSTAAFSFGRIADFKSCTFADVLEALRNGLVSGLQFGAMITLTIATATVSLPFYASIGGTMGLFFAGLLFWILATMILTLQYFLPIRAITGARFMESIRLAFFMMMDAPLFALALALDGIVCLLLSAMVAFLLPGSAGAMLAATEATRLRLYKFEWLRQTAGATRQAVPWKALLADDSEKLGDRRLKDFMFPWKK
ncbi:MAG TPA: hypothetical protein VMX33_06865 [bacterium]|nr:hypothetical protein [bacterium]